MRVRYQLTADDYVGAQIAHRNRSLVSRWANRILTAIFALLLFSMVVLLIARPESAQDAVGAGFFALFMLVLLNPRFMWKAQFRKAKSLQREYEAEATEEGLVLVTDVSRADLKWALFTKYHESRDLFVLYQQPKVVTIVPKRAFGEAEIDQFRELLRRNIASTKP
jgi:hypothetical protein